MSHLGPLPLFKTGRQTCAAGEHGAALCTVIWILINCSMARPKVPALRKAGSRRKSSSPHVQSPAPTIAGPKKNDDKHRDSCMYIYIYIYIYI